MAAMPLREADGVEILTVLDNTIDMLMAGTTQAKRFPLHPDAITREILVAEHGFAAMVTVRGNNTTESLLFDAGLSKNGLMHNLDVLEVRPQELRAIVLSHGHADHTQGLMGLVEWPREAQDAAAPASGCIPRTKDCLSRWSRTQSSPS